VTSLTVDHAGLLALQVLCQIVSALLQIKKIKPEFQHKISIPAALNVETDAMEVKKTWLSNTGRKEVLLPEMNMATIAGAHHTASQDAPITLKYLDYLPVSENSLPLSAKPLALQNQKETMRKTKPTLKNGTQCRARKTSQEKFLQTDQWLPVSQCTRTFRPTPVVSTNIKLVLIWEVTQSEL